MKKIKKFTSRVEVREIEKEIDLPAYFLLIDGSSKPSDVEHGAYFDPIVKIVDENEQGVYIGFDILNGTHKFDRSPWDNYEVVSEFTQTTKEEWDIAVSRVIKDING